jgi:hypothetical protein
MPMLSKLLTLSFREVLRKMKMRLPDFPIIKDHIPAERDFILIYWDRMFGEISGHRKGRQNWGMGEAH